MKKYIVVLFLAFFIIPTFAKASVVDNQSISLSPGWNIISTPKVLSSHQFSASEISTNFDIYLLDPTSISGWQTMQGAGQTEFQPLYAYFINNKTGANQTLQFNYNFSISIPQRLFQRTLSLGWNAVGIASPSYALFQGSPSSTDSNNPSNILNSVASAIDQVIDFTNGNTNFDSPAVSNTWLSKTVSDVNSLKDFRELKGYGIFVTNATNNYNGSQNMQVTTGILPVITLNGASTVHLLAGASYTDAGATASDTIDGNITANIITVNPVNTNVVGTYTITYNVSDSSGNNAQQVTRTVAVGPVAIINTRVSPSSPAAGQQVVSATQTTNGVTLGAFSIKAASDAATLNTLSITVGGSGASNFTNYRLFTGGTDIGGATLNGNVITFSNLTTPLALDTWTEFTIKADAVINASGTVSLTLTPTSSNIIVTDANYGTPDFTQAGSVRTTNILTLTTNQVAVSGTTATLGSAIVQTSVTVGYNATYAFTLTNNSNNDFYVSSTPGTFVSTTITGTGTTTGTALTSMITSPSTVTGDDSYNYAIPAGTARIFTFAGALRDTETNTVTFKITGINYSTAVYTSSSVTGGTIGTISTGLSALSLTASF